jgi:phosphate transport system substrate-binding protein
VKLRKTWLVLGAAVALALGVAACGDDDDSSSGGGASGLSGSIRIDGSSTVAPLTEAIAERFNADNPDVNVSVGTSGTSGGFEKFCAGETDVSDASRAIEPEEEQACADGSVEYEEVRVATDALTVVVNPENPVTCLTVEQLSSIWDRDSEIGSWSDVEDLDAEFDEDLELFGPGTDSGTFDYFTDAINGEEGVQRTDYNNVGEDDNQTVTGVAGSAGGMGYFGFSFYEENQDVLKALEVDGGDGCVAPSVETAQNDEYVPLSRPLFIYPSGEALRDETIREFVQFYLDNVNDVAETIGFIALTDEQLSESQASVDKILG